MDGKEDERKTIYREVPTTIISTTHEDQKMSAGVTTIRIVMWMTFKSLNILYIPIFIARKFKKSKICPPIKDDILLLSASELADKIRKQELTSEAVVKAYITRIEEVNPLINAVIEDRFKQALEDAKYADKLISFGTLSTEELKEKHPLLGVPLTVKGSIEVAHMKSTSGMISRANVIAKTDAVTVKYAREAGAIPLLTSNIPELCMNWESSNKLKGTTKNPHNTTRTPGGSSGGEASLLASACSVIGIGSDVAGSLRLPAHFCGVWGHKPSPGAVSYVGHYPSCKQDEQWRAAFTLGPMARYASDLKLLFEIIVEPEMKDCLMLNQPVSLKDVKVFFMEDIESCLTSKVSNDCLEALHQVIDHFNAICHNNCKEVKLPLMEYAPEMAALSLLDIDDVDNLFDGRGDGCYTELFKYVTGRSKSTFNAVLYGILRRFSGYLPRSLFENCKEKLKELKNDFIKLLDNDGVFILPTCPMEACYHGDMVRRTCDASYLWIFNGLGLPVTNCPIRFTRSGLPIGVQVKLPLMEYAPEMAALSLLDIDDVDNLFDGRGDGCYTELFKYVTGRSKSTFNAVLYGILRRFSGYLPRSLFENCKEKLKELKNDFIKLLDNDGVFILPTCPMEACYHGDMVRRTCDASYLWIFNGLGLPVTNCPIRFTRSGLPIGVQVKLPLMEYAPEMAALSLLDIDDVDNLFDGRGDGCYTELFKYVTGRSKSTFNAVLYGILRRFSGYLPRSLFENCKEKLKELKNDFIKLLDNDGVFILPTCPMEACYHGDMVRRTCDASYLWIFNGLGLPVTNCPIRFTRSGLPIGVQVVAAPNCDRLTLAVAMEIEKAFGGWKPPLVVNSH